MLQFNLNIFMCLSNVPHEFSCGTFVRTNVRICPLVGIIDFYSDTRIIYIHVLCCNPNFVDSTEVSDTR